MPRLRGLIRGQPVSRIGLCLALLHACDDPRPDREVAARTGAAVPPPPIEAGSPSPADAWYRRAVGHRQSDRAEAAIEAARKAMAHDPGHRPARRLLAALYTERGRHREVSDLLERSLAEGTADSSAVYRDLGAAYAAQGRLAAAEQALMRAIELLPADARAHNNLAAVYARSGDIGRSIETLERLVELDPEYPVGLFNLGSAYAENGRYEEAQRLLRRTLDLNPDHVGARYRLGVIDSDLGHYREAVTALQGLLASEEGYAAAHFELAKAMIGLGRRQEAIEHLERATRIDPTCTDALYRLGIERSRAGDHEGSAEALRRFRGWRRAAREDPDLWRRVDYAKLALAARPSDVNAHLALARIYARKGWSEAAAGELQQVVRIDPSHRQAWRELATLRAAAGNPDEAALVLEQIVAAWSSDVAAWNNLGISYVAAGRSDEALDAYRRALEAIPGNASLLYNLGNLHRQRADSAAALDAYRRALASEPENARIRAALERLRTSVGGKP